MAQRSLRVIVPKFTCRHSLPIFNSSDDYNSNRYLKCSYSKLEVSNQLHRSSLARDHSSPLCCHRQVYAYIRLLVGNWSIFSDHILECLQPSKEPDRALDHGRSSRKVDASNFQRVMEVISLTFSTRGTRSEIKISKAYLF
jgi:hypothetical protein